MPLEITVNGTTLTDLNEDQIFVALNLKRSDLIIYDYSGNWRIILIQNIVRNISSTGDSKLHFIGNPAPLSDVSRPKDISESATFFMSAIRGEAVEESGRHRVMGTKTLELFGGWSYALVDQA